MTYFTDDHEEIVCLDCDVVLAQGPFGFTVRWEFPVLCFPYNHRVVRRLIPFAATEAPYFNSEDDCWWHPDLRGVGFFADTMVKEIDLGGLSAYQFTYD